MSAPVNPGGSRLGSTRPAARFSLLVLALLFAAGRIVAQVGFDPEHSPFRDLRAGTGLQFGVGWFSGSRGDVGVGPSDGPTASGRFELHTAGPAVLSFGLTYAQLDRFVVLPESSAATRTKGPFANDLLFLDAGLQLRLTGQKSWRHLVPYIGAAIGLAFELSGPRDPSGYQLGTKFTIAPGAGVRLQATSRLSLFGDFRWQFWRLSYPTSYRVPSPVDSTTVLAPNQDDADWTTHPWFSAGVAWIF